MCSIAIGLGVVAHQGVQHVRAPALCCNIVGLKPVVFPLSKALVAPRYIAGLGRDAHGAADKNMSDHNDSEPYPHAAVFQTDVE